jgi:hypothetical protein
MAMKKIGLGPNKHSRPRKNGLDRLHRQAIARTAQPPKAAPGFPAAWVPGKGSETDRKGE